MPVANQDVFRPLGHIPQVAHTYGYYDQNYALVLGSVPIWPKRIAIIRSQRFVVRGESGLNLDCDLLEFCAQYCSSLLFSTNL